VSHIERFSFVLVAPENSVNFDSRGRTDRKKRASRKGTVLGYKKKVLGYKKKRKRMRILPWINDSGISYEDCGIWIHKFVRKKKRRK